MWVLYPDFPCNNNKLNMLRHILSFSHFRGGVGKASPTHALALYCKIHSNIYLKSNIQKSLITYNYNIGRV